MLDLNKLREHLAIQRKNNRPSVHVIPTKSGMWRAVMMSADRAKWWQRSWEAWWAFKGHRLAISPEMWVER